MWDLLPRGWKVSFIVAATLLIDYMADGMWGLFTGEPTGPFKWVSVISSCLLVFLGGTANFYWRVLWRRFPKLNRWVFPDLNGTWTGAVHSTWRDQATDQRAEPKSVKIVIKQSLFSVHVSLHSEESKSTSMLESLQAYPEISRYRIWYAYHSVPKAEFRDRSCPHDGMAYLEVDFDENPKRLNGLYYTARKTIGDIDVTR